MAKKGFTRAFGMRVYALIIQVFSRSYLSQVGGGWKWRKDRSQFSSNITIVTSARTDEEARFLLERLGIPFQRKDETAQIGAIG